MELSSIRGCIASCNDLSRCTAVLVITSPLEVFVMKCIHAKGCLATRIRVYMANKCFYEITLLEKANCYLVIYNKRMLMHCFLEIV